MSIHATASLTFPTPGTSFGSLKNTALALCEVDEIKEAIFLLANEAREHFENDLACAAGPEDTQVRAAFLAESSRQACWAATTAFRNGYAHHWISALAAQVDERLTDEHLATAPRIRGVVEDERATWDPRTDGPALRAHDWALALLDGADAPLPEVTSARHGGLLDAAAGAALILSVAEELDEADAEEICAGEACLLG